MQIEKHTHGDVLVKNWDESDWIIFREILQTALLTKTAEITFTKLDGDIRVMTCTLDPEILPVKVVKEGEEKPTKTLKNPTNTLVVYDVNAKGWRSFVVKNVTRVLYKDID